ncbi:MAG: SusC/RagA family TonB-linked outer membrane protein [Bacteroidales bacterium]|nr:SusC/RagA family TonB-linked outer membrane protein [Bacteroidales bacterium]
MLDQEGDPITGAAVAITGTEMRVVTDIDGRFSLPKVDSSHKTVTVTFVGMETVTQKITPDMVIVMHSQSQIMDEVVVVAFGKQKREAFTGSAAVVKSDDIVKRQANNPISALEGKVPGLTMLQSNDPTSENTINIRGLSSINASTTPLIILDGQPYNGSWRDINPADVDNISVLKDAASNALYGARGANGVIMITTKSATKGKTKITLDMKWGVNTDALRDYDVIDDPAEYYEAHYLALRNYYARSLGYSSSKAHLAANDAMTGTSIDAGGLGYILYSVPQGETLIGSNGKLNPNATLGNRVYNNGQIYTLYPDSWKDAGLRNGFRQEYNLSISGGAEKYSTYFSLGYLSDEGISYGSDVTRYTARFKTDYDAYSWLKIGGNANYSHSEYNSMNGAFSTVHTLAPIYPLFLRDQYGNVMTDARGPMYDYGDGTIGFVRPAEKNYNTIQGDKIDTYKRNSNDFGITGYANITFLKDFRLTINGGVHINEYRTNTAYNPYYGYYAATGGYVSTTTYRRNTTNFQQLLNWNHKFGKNDVEILIGHEYSRYSTANLSGSKTNIAIFDENIELDGAITNSSISGSTSLYNVEGYFGRVQYDFDSRIYASASYRRDGSSRFHPDHRWGNFWSVGGAWILSKEEWFPKSPMINMLKFKASYGEQGNDGLSSSYYWTDYYDIVNSNDNVAYTFSWKGNPDITWETNGNFNAGFEFDFFNSRLNGQVEYYNRITKDMLYFKSVPTSLGYSGYYDNIGDMKNYGVEITLNIGLVRSQNFNWNLDLNIALEKNKITYLPDNNKGLIVDGHDGYQNSNYFYGEGLPLYTWYLPKYAGPSENGEPQWYVLNEDGTTTTTTTYDQASYYLLGTALPDAYGGFGTSIQFFGFDLSANFTFTLGGKKLDAGYASLMGSPYGSTIGNNIHRDALTGWSEDNTSAWIPRWQYNDTQNSLYSDFFLISANQLTFKTCQIGYTLPKSIQSKLHVSNLRIYASCDNVWYWTKRKGFDPRGDRTTYDATGYSPMRTFVGGLNVVF